MHAMGTDQRHAEELLVAIGRHLPHGFDLGRPRLATAGDILTGAGDETALFSLDEGGGEVSRLVELGGGLAEVTRWAYGEEISRCLVRGGPDGDGRGGDADDPEPAPAPDPVGVVA